MTNFQLFSLREFIIWYDTNLLMKAILYDPLINIISTKGNWAATSTLKDVGGPDENS